jgi:ATP-dependent helicase/nuclease subunit A
MIDDHHVRNKAIDPLKSFIVQAPAGSGKTELLMQRILTLLLTVKEPEEVMALTFTKKAVEEMRDRVLTALLNAKNKTPVENEHQKKSRSLAEAVLEHDAQHQWNLIDSPHRLHISTIDALSLKICQGSPKETLLPLDITPLDNPTDLYKQAILQTFQEDKNNHFAGELQTLLLHCDNQYQVLENLLCKLIAERDQWLSLVMPYYHEPLQLKNACEEVMNDILKSHLTTIQNNLPPNCLFPLWQSLFFSVHQCKQAVDWTFDVCLLDQDPNHCYVWLDAANLLLTQEGNWRSPRSINKTLGFSTDYPEEKSACQHLLTTLSQSDHQESLRQSLHALRDCPTLHYHKDSWEILKACLQCLPEIVAQCQLLFQSLGECDYVELTLAACRVLDQDAYSQKAQLLNHRISHILIDECQDTSIIQATLLTQLTQHWQMDEHKTLFLVGDPMQSIYRFRQAEVSLFHHWQTHGFGSIALTPLQLTCNFRSEKNLIDWFNVQFKAIFPSDYFAQLGAIPYAPSTAVKLGTQENPVQAYILVDGNANDEACHIIETIEKNPNKSIAILLQKRSQARVIIQALNANSIAFEASDIEPILLHPLTQDWLMCLRALCHFDDAIAWYALVRSPICGATLETLLRIREKSESSAVASVFLDSNFESTFSQNPQLLHFKLRLNQVFQQSNDPPLWQMIRLAWSTLGFDDYYHRDSDRIIFSQCQDLLKSLNWHRHTFDRDALMQRLEKTYCKSSASAPIQLMTIHKSKGLEFDTVIIPGLQIKSRPEEKSLITWQTIIIDDQDPKFCIAPFPSKEQKQEKIYDYCRIIEEKKLQEERKRLLYVACTRAKNQLFLSATLEKKKESDILSEQCSPPKNTFADMLWPFLSTKAHQLPCAEKEVNAIAPLPKLTKPTQDWLEKKSLAIDAKMPTIRPVHNHVSLHLNHLTHQTKAQHFGDALHALCEKIPIHGLHHDYRGLIESIAQQFSSVFQPKARMIDKLTQALQTMQPCQKAAWIFAPHEGAHSEWVILEKQNFGVRKHIIDRSFITNKTRWIIDFKSACPAENECSDTFLENQKNNYLKQLRRYQQCVALLNENLPIQCGLYFPLCGLWIEAFMDG